MAFCRYSHLIFVMLTISSIYKKVRIKAIILNFRIEKDPINRANFDPTINFNLFIFQLLNTITFIHSPPVHAFGPERSRS